MGTEYNAIALWRERSKNNYLLGQKGVIVSWTELFVAPVPFEHEVPYVLAIIALDNGKRMLCPLVDVQEDQLTVGSRVQLVTRVMHVPDSNTVITYGDKAIIMNDQEPI